MQQHSDQARRYDDDLRFAHVLADNADDITMRRFRALDLRVDTKPDLTPVSDADQTAEESLRNVLRRSRPRDAVLGEETGRTGFGPRCWIIDPIDGTKNYVRGVPVWATLIALERDGRAEVAVVSAPALALPCGAAEYGLSASAQLVGRRGDDALVLAAGLALERLLAPTVSDTCQRPGLEKPPVYRVSRPDAGDAA